jgi:Flp pilus assembly protein TadG
VTVLRRLAGERGSVAISGLLAAAALIVLIGSGVDFAHAFIVRRDLTAVVDNAALTGSQQLDVQAWRDGRLALDPGQAEQAADAELAAVPEIVGVAHASVYSVTVEARQRIRTMMLRLVGLPELTIGARATAQPREP